MNHVVSTRAHGRLGGRGWGWPRFQQAHPQRQHLGRRPGLRFGTRAEENEGVRKPAGLRGPARSRRTRRPILACGYIDL